MTKRGKSLKEAITKKIPGTKKQKRQDIKLHQHLLARYNAKKEARLRKKAEYYATLPKGRLKRTLYRMHPKRVAKFVFSRDGLIFGLRAFGICVLLGVVALFVVFAYFRKDLPKNITDLKSCSQGQKTSYYDRTGEILLWRGEGDVDCQPVPLADINENLREAVIAAEDQSFFEHPGFDVRGLTNAALSNASGDGNGRGGSTITQQYVKLAVLNDNERSITRKIKELILAIELERSYSKDEILQAYLNEISFGSVYNGAEAAAKGFFEKSAKDLTLDEAATFAAAIQAPGTYWEDDTEGLIERRNNYVLEQMVSLGYATREEADAAKQVDTLAKLSKTRNKYKDIKAPHFVLEVQKQLEEEFGTTNLRRQGYKVITTLDMSKQQMAEEAIANGMAKVDAGNLNNAALVSEEVATGQVVAYVGSRDFNYPGFGEKNVAGTPRSPGSSWKPYDFAALMKSSENWGAGSIMYDLDTTWSGYGAPYRPRDYDFLQPGPVSIRYALGGSRNTPAIKAMYIAGIKETQDLAIAMGLKSGLNCAFDCTQILSTAIGDGGEIRLDENVHGYATFSRLGKNIPQVFVLKILDSKGKVIRDNTAEPVGEQVLDPQIAYIMSDMLSDVNASYFRGGRSWAGANRDYDDRTIPTAIKTGTTDRSDNGWLMGYTTRYATGVWIGHNENKTASNFMEQMTSPIWSEYMRRAHEGQEVPPRWTQPEGIKTVAHDNAFYALVKGACTGVRNGNICGYGQSDIYPSWYTPRKSTNNQEKVVIDTVSNKRATDCTPARARKEVTGGGIIVPEVDAADPNYRNFMSPIQARLKSGAGEAIPPEDQKDDIHQCSDSRPQVSQPSVNEVGGSGVYEISVNVTAGTHALRNLYFKMDGQTISGGALDITAGGNYSIEWTADTGGTHEFTAEVVDSALYDNTSAGTSVNLNSIPFVLTIGPGTLPSQVKLSWDAISLNGYSLSTSGAANGSTSCTQEGSKCTRTVNKSQLGSSVKIIHDTSGRETNSVDVP